MVNTDVRRFPSNRLGNLMPLSRVLGGVVVLRLIESYGNSESLFGGPVSVWFFLV